MAKYFLSWKTGRDFRPTMNHFDLADNRYEEACEILGNTENTMADSAGHLRQTGQDAGRTKILVLIIKNIT